MKKIALATAAILMTATGAFAASDLNPNSADRPSTWQNQAASDVDYSSTAAITAREVVAQQIGSGPNGADRPH